MKAFCSMLELKAKNLLKWAHHVNIQNFIFRSKLKHLILTMRNECHFYEYMRLVLGFLRFMFVYLPC